MSTEEEQGTEGALHLYDLLGEFETAMLVTRSADGHLHARPMVVAESHADADAYLVTNADSPKVAEIYADADVLLFQSASRYAAVYGRVNVVRDRALVDLLWSDSWKSWFPRGKSDPAIALRRFDAEQGEFWNDADMRGARYVFEASNGYLLGGTARPELGRRERPGH